MRKRRRRYIQLLLRGLLLVAVFLCAVALVYKVTHKESVQTDSSISWENPSLPVVSVQVDGSYMNLMYGYVDEMVDRYMRDTVTPLDADGTLKIRISEDGEKVRTVRYEIKSLDGAQLIEDATLKDWKEKEKKDGTSYIDVSLPVQNSLTEGEEYQLKLYLSTDAHETVYYYTRIVKSTEFETSEMLDFVRSFQKKTLNPDLAKGMVSYMKETTDSGNSLGFVTLHSTYKQLLWNYLRPEVTGNIQVRLTDINDSIGTFVLDYQVSFEDDYGSHLCNVEEVYTVQITNGSKFLLVYERSVNEKLSIDAIDSSKDRIRLGIIQDDSVRVLSSEEGTNQLLSYNGDVWLNQVDEDDNLSMTELLSFHTDDEDMRSRHDAYKVNLVSVDDEGNAGFFIYGYMNQGRHEGEVGLTFYQYDGSAGTMKEIFFLPFDRSFSVLEQEVGQLSYVSGSNLFYLMMNNCVYAIDFSGKEYVTVVENVSDDDLWVSDDESVIAWEESSNSYGAKTVHIYNLETSTQSTVTASGKEALLPIGFIDRELALGCVKKAQQKKYGSKTSPVMYAVKIVSDTGKTLATYKKDNILITSATIENGSVLMTRASIKSGDLRAVSDDALIENANRDTAEDELLAKTTPTDGYPVWYMKEEMKTAPEEFGKITEVTVSDDSELNIDVKDEENGLFFAYAKGKLQAICSTTEEAVSAVYDDIGYVTDSNGYYVMRRGYRDVSYLSITESEYSTDADKQKEIAMTAFSDFENGSYSESFKEMEKEGLSDVEMLQRGVDGIVYDLTGCQLSQVGYYFLHYKHPLYALTKDGPVLISGISGDTVYMWSAATGQTTNVTIDKAESMLRAKGNVLYSCMTH